jgi:integrase
VLKGLGLDTAKREPAPKAAKTVSTETQVRAARPRVYRVTDVRRLYLKKTSRDTGSYFLRYRIEGRRPGMGLGSIGDVSLAEVRALAEELGGKLGKKTDPLAERNASRAAALEKAQADARKAATKTVEEAVKAYAEDRATSWRHVYARSNWLNPIATHAFPLIGHLKVDAVEPRHILTVVKAMEDKGVSVLGRKVRSRLKTVFDFLAAHGERDAKLSNPADAGVINAGHPQSGEDETEHYRRIALDVAPSVFARLVGLAPNSAAVAAWIFMALTAARPGEALAARWDQIDFDKNLWLNPAPKTKKTRKKAKAKTETAKPLAVPLSSLALKILDMAKAFGSGELIFPSRGGSKLAHSTFAAAPARAGIDAGSPHSWRSIFRNWAEDIGGFRRETAEAALGHSLGAVEKAYRRETGVEARRLMMAAYANWLTGEGEGNVVAFPARA